MDLSRITCPLHAPDGQADHLVPPAQSEGIQAPGRVEGHQVPMTLDAGHIGLAVSSKAHKVFWPEATQWLADRSGRVSY